MVVALLETIVEGLSPGYNGQWEDADRADRADRTSGEIRLEPWG